MEPKKNKYDTNPLDPSVAKKTEEVWGDAGDRSDTQQVKGATGQVGPAADSPRSNIYSEAPTRHFDDLPNADAVAKALDIAQAAGVKLLIHCPELEREPEQTVARFRTHPALEGFHLRDEPSELHICHPVVVRYCLSKVRSCCCVNML